MPRIPIYQRQNIGTPNVIDNGLGSIGKAVSNTANAALRLDFLRQKQQDKIVANQLASDFQLQTLDDWQKFKASRADNPIGLADDFDSFLRKKKQDILNSKDYNKDVKEQVSKFIDSNRISFKQKALQEQDNLVLNNFGAKIEQSSQNNNLLAYKAGQSLDLSSLDNVNNLIKNNVQASQGIVSSDIAEEMKITQTQNAYSNFFKGSLENHPDQTLELLDSGKFDKELGADNLISLRNKALSILQERKGEKEKQDKLYNTALPAINAMNGFNNLMTNASTEDVKSVDAYWETLKKEGKIQNDFTQNLQVAQEIFRNTNIIPTPIKDDLAAQLQNGETGQKMEAVKFIDNINRKNLIAYEDLSPKVQGLYTSISSYISAGADPDTASKWAMQNLGKADNQREFRQKTFNQQYGGISQKSLDNRKSLENKLADSFDYRIFGFNPQIEDDVKTDFYNNFEAFYINEGLDEDQAFKASVNILKTKYNVSELTGKSVVTKYSPEAFYGNTNTSINPTEWIKADWKNFVEKKTGIPLEKDFNKDLVLEVAPFSENTNKPVYYVKKKNGTNLDYLTDTNGNILLYQPNLKRYVENELKNKKPELTQKQKEVY